MCISQKLKCYNAKLSVYYFYVKTKILVDFHICISVPLRCPLAQFIIFNSLWDIAEHFIKSNYYLILKAAGSGIRNLSINRF